MSLLDVVQAISDKIAASGAAATVLLGREFVGERAEVDTYQDTVLRVVLVPTAVAYSEPLEIGGNPQRLANRRQTFEVHCSARAPSQATDPTLQRGKDLDLAGQLADQVVIALARLPHAVADWADLTGTGSYGDDPTTLGFGATVKFSISVDMPVIDAPWVVVGDANPGVQGAMHSDVTGVDVGIL